MRSFRALRSLAFAALVAGTPVAAEQPPQFREPTPADTAKIESLISQSYDAAKLGDRFRESQKLREAVRVFDGTYGPMHPQTADRLVSMSIGYRAELGEALLRRALHIHENLDMDKAAGWDMLDLGTILVEDFRFHEAIDVLQTGLKLLESDPPDTGGVALAHFQLGLALSRTGRYDEAQTSFEKSLAIRTGLFGPNSMAVRQTLDGEALNLLRKGQYHEAEKTLLNALNVDAKGQETGRLRAEMLLGQTYIAEGKYGDAAQIFSRAVSLMRDRRMSGLPEGYDAIVGLAEARRRLGDFAQAVQLFREGCKPTGGSRSPDVYDDGLSTCLAQAALAAHGWAAQGGGSAAADNPTALKSEAFEWAQAAELSRAAKALAGYGARSEAAARNAGNLVRAYNVALRSHDAAERQYMATFGRRNGKALRPGLVERLASQEEDIDRIGEQIADQSPLYWDLQDIAPVKLQELQARSGNASRLLGEDEILVEAFLPSHGEPGLVFAATKERLEWSEIPLTESQIAQIVAELRAEIDPGAYAVGHDDSAKERSTFKPALAHSLYNALYGAPQISAMLDDKSKTKLLFVPSGALFSFPPGLLVTKAPPATLTPAAIRDTAWLLKQKAISVLPDVASLRTLRELLPEVAILPSEPLLALADPDFSGDGKTRPCESGTVSGGPAAADLVEIDGAANTAVLRRYLSQQPLPCTRAEGKALRDMLGGTLLVGGQASKTEIMRRDADGSLERQRVVAFMTHAFVVGDFGLAEPALALAAPHSGSSASDDGLLTMSDIARLTLNADWVILSACNTGAPESSTAERTYAPGQTFGLSGLTRSFFGAGTKALLVSNWQVSDLDAASLVPDVVQRHYRGVPRAQALQQASLEMMRDHNANPAAWGVFTLLGEPN